MDIRTFGLFFGLMFINYCLNAINFRMIAKGHYVGVGVTDAAIALFGFTLIQHVATANTLYAQAGYVTGGVCGSLVGLWLTKRNEK